MLDIIRAGIVGFVVMFAIGARRVQVPHDLCNDSRIVNGVFIHITLGGKA